MLNKLSQINKSTRNLLIVLIVLVIISIIFFVTEGSHAHSSSLTQRLIDIEYKIERQANFYENNYKCRYKGVTFDPLQLIPYNEDAWYSDHHIIAHALGGIDGFEYTNSNEAFLNSYENGFRLFEADIFFTTDGVPVLFHDRPERSIINELAQGEVYASWFSDNVDPHGLTDMTLDDFLEYMILYPDIYLITDAKNYLFDMTQSQYNLMVAQYIYDWTIDNNHPEIIDRVVIQIYSESCHSEIQSIPASFDYIYTLYAFYQKDTVDHFEIARFCVENDISAVVMPYEWATVSIMDIYYQYGLPVYVHAVNDMALLRSQYIVGVYGVFSSYISPEDSTRSFQRYSIR